MKADAEAALQAVREATPAPWRDGSLLGLIPDRFVLNQLALLYWLTIHFDMKPDDLPARVPHIDALAERIVVDGEPYQIPAACYQSLLRPGHD